MKASILGHESDLEYSPVLAGYAIVGLRAGLGWLFFHRGVTRVLDPTWSIHSVIANVPPANPFPWACEWMGAHAAWLLDPLFSWGFVLAGACLLFGAFLGAGAIIRDQASIRGLTTAASLWCTAAVGLACGFGMFLVAAPQAVAADIRKAVAKRRNVIYTPWFWLIIMTIIRSVPEWIFKRLQI